MHLIVSFINTDYTKGRNFISLQLKEVAELAQ